jgi:hypothetical protein
VLDWQADCKSVTSGKSALRSNCHPHQLGVLAALFASNTEATDAQHLAAASATNSGPRMMAYDDGKRSNRRAVVRVSRWLRCAVPRTQFVESAAGHEISRLVRHAAVMKRYVIAAHTLSAAAVIRRVGARGRCKRPDRIRTLGACFNRLMSKLQPPP